MNLGEATRFLDPANAIACACAGRAPGESLCYCEALTRDARQLRRGAQIVAKLLDDAAHRVTCPKNDQCPTRGNCTTCPLVTTQAQAGLRYMTSRYGRFTVTRRFNPPPSDRT